MAEDRSTQRLEHGVHWALLGGLIVSGALLAVGLVLTLTRGESRPDGPTPTFSRTLRAAGRGDSVALIDLGLLALICTPVLRVAVLAVGWSAAGDRRFAAVAFCVLALLGLGFALGVG